MKIGVRIALMGVVLALISVVISVTSINSLDSLNEEIHLISEDRVPKTILANDIIDNVNLVARSVRNMIILDINKEREKVLEQDEHIAEATKNIADRLGKLTETITTPEGIQMLEAVKTARQNLLPEIKKVSELTKQGRDEEAEVILYGEYERLQGEYMEAVTRLIEYQNELVQKASASATEVVESSGMTIYILIGAGILLAFLITWFITRSITAPIRKCMVAAENLGEGNMNVDLETKSKDETGALLRAMDSMRGNIQKMVAELNQIAAAATNGQLDQRAHDAEFKGEYKNIMVGFNNTLDAVIGPLNVTAEYVDRISKGDIPPRITDDYKGDFNEIKNNLNQCIDVMNGLLAETDKLIKATQNGQLDQRGNASKFVGGWGELVGGVNDLVDAFVGPLNVTAEYVDRISKGDIPPVITDEYKGDFNEIKNNLNQCIDVMNGLLSETDMLIKATQNGQLDKRGNASKFVGGWGELVGGVNKLVDAFVGPINVTAEYVDRISKGDIPPIITDEYKGDFNEIKNNLNQCIDALSTLIKDMNHMSKEHDAGDIDVDMNPDKFQGAYKEMANGLNEMVQGHINVKKRAMAVVKEYAEGNFDEEMEKLPGKKRFINDTLDAVKGNLLSFSHELDGLIKATKDGKLDRRGNAANFKGDWGELVGGVNELIDAFVGPINVTAEYVDRISKGDIPPKITDEYKGDFNEIKANLNTCITAINLMVEDAGMLVEAALAGQLQTRAEANRHQGDFRKIIGGVNETLDAVIDPINEAGTALERMAGGDLTARMKGNYKGDLSKLKNNLNSMGKSLSEVMMRVADAVSTVASATLQISSTSETMASAAQEQSAQADEVASAVEEMSRTITENAMSANKTAEVSKRNSDTAQESGRVVEQTVGKMRDIARVVKQSAENIEKLGESSKEIGEIIAVIDDIADQTNLLALNAAIEAARAGEQGRGFAVVADEVRKLAERTTEATKQIASMIKGIQNETQEAVRVMNQGNEEVSSGIELADRAGGALQEILQSSQDVLDMINQIAAASEEQSATSEEISKNVLAISSVTSESAQQIQDIAHSSDDLSKLTEHLSELINQFRVEAEKNKSDDDHEFDVNGHKKNKSLHDKEKHLLPE